MILIKEVFKSEKYRESFWELARNVFCLDFEPWYKKWFFNRKI